MVKDFGEKLDIYEGARGLSVKILNRVDRTDAYLDKLLDNEIKSKYLSEPDKGLLVELVNGVIRWKLRLDWLLDSFYHGNYSKVEIDLKNTLRVALYQILFLDRIPEHAAVNEAVGFIKKIKGEKAGNLVNAVLRNILRNKNNIKYPESERDINNHLSIVYSHPLWLVKRWTERFGPEETEKLLEANNHIPDVTIRINKLLIEPVKFISEIEKLDIPFKPSEYLGYYLKVRQLSEISNLELFTEGYFTVQDESAAFPVILLDPRQGEKIIDMCAAPGGKTTHIGELMKNSGSIIAVDKYEHKLELIKNNCSRLSINNVECISADATEFSTEGADKILVDVPCTGLGVLRKKPDIKWKRELTDLKKLINHQMLILENAGKNIRTGGVIVYSTCTMEPEENMLIIKEFLRNHEGFELDNAAKFVNQSLVNSSGAVETFPHKHNMDGSFAARLIKIK